MFTKTNNSLQKSPAGQLQKSMAVTLILLVGTVIEAAAQGGAAGIAAANNQIRSFIPGVSTLTLGIALVTGFVGAIKVYQKISSGDPEAGKGISSWIGACVFMSVVTLILNAFFQ
jgi:hypothetical protein